MMNEQNRQMTKTEITGKAHNLMAEGFAQRAAQQKETREMKQQVAEMQHAKEVEDVTAQSIRYLQEQGYRIEK